MELCSGKGLEMLYFTNEIMKQRVSGLGEEHRKLYKFFADYYRELNTAPLIEDMVLEMRASSKEKVYSLLSDLAAAGCLTAWDGEKRMRPSLSPEVPHKEGRHRVLFHEGRGCAGVQRLHEAVPGFIPVPAHP